MTPFSPETLIDTILVDWPLSNRNAGQGRHWGVSASIKKRLNLAIRNAMGEEPIAFDVKVDIMVVRILGSNQRLWDSDSILRGDSKQLIDALVTNDVLKDDGPKFVRYTIGVQDTMRRESGPAVEIRFYNAKESECLTY